MKIMIEVSGGVVCSVTTTQECDIYLIDHDNIKQMGCSPSDSLTAMQPDCITWEEELTPIFDEYLNESLSEYKGEKYEI